MIKTDSFLVRANSVQAKNEDVETFSQAGLILYHGTSPKYIYKILTEGLDTKNNKHELQDLKKGRKESTKAIFCHPNLKVATFYAQRAPGSNMVYYFVLGFKTKSTDKLGKERFEKDEVLVLNKIEPSRLKVIYPKKFDLEDYNFARPQKAVDKTDKIKAINKKIKSLGFMVKSGSSKNDRLLLYKWKHNPYRDPPRDEWQYADESFLPGTESKDIIAKYKLPKDTFDAFKV